MMQAIPAFGDSIGGMNIAGGIAAALFHREKTGQAVELDVSLMSTGWWAAGAGFAQALETGVVPRARRPSDAAKASPFPGNPFLGNFRTSDGGFINLCVLTPGPYIKDTFEHLGLPEAAADPRFSTAEALMANWADASALIVAAIGKQSFDYWRARLRSMKGQWAPFQSLKDLATDEQALANDMIIEVEAIDGGPPIKLARGPVQFDHAPVVTTRAPQAAEHTELFLMEIGVDWDRIESLKAAGVLA
jgi:crotonobetainyl-CoA:carnitine CoA-transferase CaiB-like acyl-CoA transferase